MEGPAEPPAELLSPHMAKFIFFTGGVASSLGKGITAASLGRLLKSRGLSVSIQKLDPYINVDAGTMNPYQHGEVFVTDDGAETDLDLGHYERFIDEALTPRQQRHDRPDLRLGDRKRAPRRLSGRDRSSDPAHHERDQGADQRVAETSGADVCIVEVGGTVGDIESLPFLEAIRQIRHDVGDENVMFVHLTLLPHLGAADELKTKPTQHSVRELRAIGISPDAIVVRTASERPISRELKEKIALFCDVRASAVVQNGDAPTIYRVPLNLEAEGLAEAAIRKLRLVTRPLDLEDWERDRRADRSTRTHDVRSRSSGNTSSSRTPTSRSTRRCYHAGIFHDARVEIVRIDSETIEETGLSVLADVDGVLVAPGFGARGVKGKLRAIQYAREAKIPFLGICLRHAARLRRVRAQRLRPAATR